MSELNMETETPLNHINPPAAKPLLAVRAFSVEIISDNPADGLLSKETVSKLPTHAKRWDGL